MVKQRHQLFVSLLVGADGAVAAAACYAAWVMRRVNVEGYRPNSWETWFKEPLVFFVVPVVLYAMWAMGLYRPRRDRTILSEQLHVARATVLSLAGIVVVLWLAGNDAVGTKVGAADAIVFGRAVDAGRYQIGLLAMMLPAGMAVHRLIFRLVLRRLRSRGRNLRHVAVIGTGRLGQICAQTIGRNSWTGIKVSYFVSHHETTRRTKCLDRPVFSGLGDLAETLERSPVDAVYICVPSRMAADVPKVLKTLAKFPFDVRIVPDVPLRYTHQAMQLGELDGMPVLSYRENPMAGPAGVVKRGVDVLGALAGLVLFSPVMMVCWVAVRLSGPGPVIFKQRRVSIGGQQFKIYKFRTMYSVDDERHPAVTIPGWTERDDPRVTHVGRFMRATSLDELPQLLNVLKGQMSLVGPRPERPELIERFREDWRGYMLRSHVKAGITGWAQVNGLRGDTSLRKRLQYDLHYIKHWSLLFDLRILLMTPVRGFVHRNAH